MYRINNHSQSTHVCCGNLACTLQCIQQEQFTYSLTLYTDVSGQSSQKN